VKDHRRLNSHIREVAHPIDVNARRMFEEEVLAEYFRVSGLSTPG
jgi:DNA-binding cell septation regulator SpoVG